MTGFKGVLGVVMAIAGLLVFGVAAASADSCANAEFRVGPSAGLPDCRAFEMVSPLEKGGNAIAFAGARAAVGGEAVTYLSTGAFDEPKGMNLLDRYLSQRGPDGWSTTNISPRNATYRLHGRAPFEETVFTPELSAGVLTSQDEPLIDGEPLGYDEVYRWSADSDSYQAVSGTPPPNEVEPYRDAFNIPVLVGASTDLSHVAFEQEASLVEGASPRKIHVYEWAGGRLSQVDVPPAGVSFEAVDQGGAPTAYYAGNYGQENNMWHAVSADGSRVFFTAGEAGTSKGVEEDEGQVYVRENPMAPQSPSEHGVCTVPADACTVEVSASQRAVPDPHGPQPAFFSGASADGSLVFLISDAELTDDANTGPADSAPNLYAYDLNTGVLSDLSVDTNPGDVDGAGVAGFITAAEDGSYVYFVANGVLAGNTNGPLAEKAESGDCKLNSASSPVPGEHTCNLYVEHFNGSSWEAPRFVAKLAGSTLTGHNDERDWEDFTESEFDFGPGQHQVRVTPDGTRLAFESVRSLTGYDNVPVSPGECENEKCSVSEVYLYDASTGSLVCASCDANGAAPVAGAMLGASHDEQGEAFSYFSAYYEAHNLSSNGRRLFFQSRDPLVPWDTNGRQDVYEWEADGEGSCAQEPGCVLPVSDVAGESDSFFMDASPSGNDVFIATGDQLVPSDTDDLRDVYDVRVDGGFPAAPVAAAACGSADACRGPAGVGPGLGSPASATFSGSRNLAPAPSSVPVAKPKSKRKAKECARGFVRKHGQCVRQRRSRGRIKRRGSSLRAGAPRTSSGRGR